MRIKLPKSVALGTRMELRIRKSQKRDYDRAARLAGFYDTSGWIRQTLDAEARRALRAKAKEAA